MEAAASRLGYKDPPWKFQGSALYQFHLVRSEVARALVPKEFRLVEAFGYTLGGFFLASYEDSPAGVFDELVVIAGLVWNPPTSCAWASRVLVSSNEACIHGRKDVGLPSHVASFSKTLGIAQSRVNSETTTPKQDNEHGFLRRIGYSSTEVTQLTGPLHDIFSINLIDTRNYGNKTWMGPSVNMSLPSFSGRTKDNPCLLKYSCQMACRVRMVKPLRVTTSCSVVDKQAENTDQSTKEPKTDANHLSLLVMLSKPVLTLEFNQMNMNVKAPVVISE